MTQTTTNRSLYRMLPGHVVMPSGSGNEPESIVAPYNVQQFTFTFAGGASPLAAGAYTVTFITPLNGSIVVSITSDGTLTYTQGATALAAAINVAIGVDSLFYATSSGVITTAYAKSPNTDIATPVTAVPGADTLTAAESVAPSAPGLRMGLWYIYSEAAATPYAITGTPRGCNVAALPNANTVIADLRGIVARATSQTELSPTFNDANTFDAYVAGQVAPGLNRGLVCAVVDPASGTMTPGGEVHVVIAAGTYSVIGAVANAAGAGAETIRVDNAPTGNILARVPVNGHEETMTFGNYTGRLVELKVNCTN
jgi:hypothetical protein